MLLRGKSNLPEETTAMVMSSEEHTYGNSVAEDL